MDMKVKGTGVDEEVLGRYGVKERSAKGLMVLNFVKRVEMAIVNNYFKKDCILLEDSV